MTALEAKRTRALKAAEASEGDGERKFVYGETEGSTVISDVKFDAVFKRVTARLTDAERAAWFAVAQTFDDLPLAIEAEAHKQGSNGNEIAGVFHRGKVYLVRDRFASETWLEEAILHKQDGLQFLAGSRVIHQR